MSTPTLQPARSDRPAPLGAWDVRTTTIALAVALTIHAAAGIALVRHDGRWAASDVRPVEIDVNEPPPPPLPAAVPEPEPPRPPEAVQPKLIKRPAVPREAPRPSPPSLASPPPNQAKAVGDAPPVFGVTMSSVVSGEAAMAVPVGNTTMTKSRAQSDTPPRPYANDGTKPFVPEPEIYIATPAHLLREVNSEDYYPPTARALGIEGNVKLSVGINEKGQVVEVRVIRSAGHGFDEKAVEAMKEVLFSPALASDGHPVPCRITFDYTFELKS